MSLAEQIQKTRKSNERLKDQIRERRDALNDTSLTDYAKAEPEIKLGIEVRKILKGHLAKIYALQWSDDNASLVSASQDGKMLIWDAMTTNKLQIIPLKSSWVMACAYSPVDTQMVACGGLDNICSVYNLQTKVSPITPCRELVGHSGYISSCKFLTSSQILTASGDMTAILWDIEKGSRISQFSGHNGDVMCISISPDKKTFVTGACDATAKIWDIRTTECTQTFLGHESDINTAHFFPNGLSFATGSDDASCRLFDVRADRELQCFTSEELVSSVTSVAFSHSGGLLFAGYDDRCCVAWDVLKGTKAGALHHDNKVSCMGVTKDGNALATGSWDTFIRIWA